MMKKKKIATFAVAVTGSIALGVAMGGCGIAAMDSPANTAAPTSETVETVSPNRVFWTDENKEGELVPPGDVTQEMVIERPEDGWKLHEKRYVTTDGRWQATCIYFDGGLDCV